MAEQDQTNLWGPIDQTKWKLIPSISGRLAGEDDVKDGRAVFHLQNGAELGAEPFKIQLPRPAIFKNREVGTFTPVIIIQAETLDGKTYIGYRELKGGNGVCTLEEVELRTEF